MMPWREQLRLGRSLARRLFWPAGDPAWVNIVVLICALAALISLITGNLWGFAGAFAVCMTVDIVMREEA